MAKNMPANARDIRDTGSIPGSGRSPGGGHGNPLQYFYLGKSQGQRSLVSYSPQGLREVDTTEVTGHGLIARDFTGKWYPGIEQEGKGNRTALPCSSKSPVLRWD